MENPTTQKDSSKMNLTRRAGLFILLFGLGLLFWSVPAHSRKRGCRPCDRRGVTRRAVAQRRTAGC